LREESEAKFTLLFFELDVKRLSYSVDKILNLMYIIYTKKKKGNEKMTITFYVDWEAERIYKNESELVEGYLEYSGEDIHFNDFLNLNYESNTLFNATEDEKKNILERYNKELSEEAKDWAVSNNMKHTIEI
jgi:hypothetical protein